MMTVVEEVSDLFERGGSGAYFGERVTQLQHALQCAHWATEAHADDELVVAALLHDIGHLLGGDVHAEIGVIDHDRSCVEWLKARGFSERLIALVSGHVSAKRYLVASRAGYFDRLSEASVRTLALQGGPMNAEEVRTFEAGPHFKDLLRLRSWDEQAKDPNAEAPGLDRYLGLIENLGYAVRMPQISLEQASFLLNGVYLPGLKNEHRLTKNVIEAIPLDKGDFRPDDIAKTALQLAWHIVGTENRFLDAVIHGGFNLEPNPMPESIHNSSDLNAWYEEQFQTRLAQVAALSDEQMMKVVDFRGVFQLPAVMYLGFVLHHTVHHRGQLSMYLRPMGAKVPSIYGESYDAAEARKAAQA
jgi:phosphonate degradation associated HDIG domain protein